jgi:hypothetical protein
MTVSLCALFITACGATTYDNTLGTTVPPINTTTLPSGTVEELLPRLVTAMTGLSSLIGPNDSGRTMPGKADQLALINALWNAAETELITIEYRSNRESSGRC